MSKSGPMNCGNVNMKGKKVKLLSCRCCHCLDLRDKMNEKVVKKEIKSDSDPHYIDQIEAEAAYYGGCD